MKANMIFMFLALSLFANTVIAQCDNHTDAGLFSTTLGWSCTTNYHLIESTQDQAIYAYNRCRFCITDTSNVNDEPEIIDTLVIKRDPIYANLIWINGKEFEYIHSSYFSTDSFSFSTEVNPFDFGPQEKYVPEPFGTWKIEGLTWTEIIDGYLYEKVSKNLLVSPRIVSIPVKGFRFDKYSFIKTQDESLEFIPLWYKGEAYLLQVYFNGNKWVPMDIINFSDDRDIAYSSSFSYFLLDEKYIEEPFGSKTFRKWWVYLKVKRFFN